MMKKMIPVLVACLALLTACERMPPEAPAAAAAPSVPAVGMIETENYVMTLHRAIPFTPKTDALGLIKAKDGHRYVVLDISVQNKSREVLEMGTIMLFSKVTDKNGKSYGGNLGALTAWALDNPDPKHQDEYDAVWSMEFPPGETHRAVVLGLELPLDVTELVFSAPVKANMNSETRQIRFPVI
ncbi:MAG TPA: hypothetical protein VIM12_11345 [Noviherbaspirillum sp.]|uniref:hypothetical protein n=1 Tax=Noviherbaspirillum sp. TaxID=1926288 RepID=UPI002F9284C8